MKILAHKRFIKIFILTIFFAGIFSGYAQAQPPKKTRILFLMDGSQSMLGLWGNKQKIKVATRLMSELMDSLKNIDNLEVALRIYGHQFSVAAGFRSCEDTKLEVPFSKGNHQKIKDKLYEIYPKGTTPIAYSLEKAANDFTPCNNCKNVIILITDGIEECNGDPCAVALALQRNGVTLKPFVIGMGLDLETIEAFRCVGEFFDTKDEESFKNVLNVVISQAINNTSAQVNLLDTKGEPSETDVNMTFYDNHSGAIKYNFIHTINHRGVPDTIPLDPSIKYKMVVHTLPPVVKKDIKITAGQHNIIAVDAPQGFLNLKMSGLNEYKNLRCIVRKKGTMQTLYLQEFDKKMKYLVGNYDLEVLTLPRLLINDVNVAQSHTTKVLIPAPGLVNVFMTAKGIVSIFVEENNELTLVCNISQNTNRETIVLQPGNYRVVHRGVNAKKVIYTVEKSFKITSGSSTQVKF